MGSWCCVVETMLTELIKTTSTSNTSSLDVKNSTAPKKTLKKHVFLGLKKNTKKCFSHLG